MEIRTISGQVVSVGETEIELLIDGFRGFRIFQITDDMPDGFREEEATFTAIVPATALLYDARNLQWRDMSDVSFMPWHE